MDADSITLDSVDMARLQSLASMWGITPAEALKRALSEAAPPSPPMPFAAPLENSTSSQAPVEYNLWASQ